MTIIGLDLETCISLLAAFAVALYAAGASWTRYRLQCAVQDAEAEQEAALFRQLAAEDDGPDVIVFPKSPWLADQLAELSQWSARMSGRRQDKSTGPGLS